MKFYICLLFIVLLTLLSSNSVCAQEEQEFEIINKKNVNPEDCTGDLVYQECATPCERLCDDPSTDT